MKWRPISALAGCAFVAALAITILVTTAPPSAAVGTGGPLFGVPRVDYSPLVFTYFYYWYDLPNGPHSAELTNRPAEPNASYRSVDWFRKQLGDMEEAGIDVALAVYWWTSEPSSDIGLINLVLAAREQRLRGRTPPRIAMFYDTGLIASWPVDERDLTKRVNQERFYQPIRQFHALLPRDQWVTIDGRPVIWFWATWVGILFDQEVIDHVRARFTEDYGVAPFIVLEQSWRRPLLRDSFGVPHLTNGRVTADEFYEWGAALLGYRAPSGIAQVGPGYDERPLGGPSREGRYREREDGTFYANQWEAALASTRRLLAIETWNEFHEATNVADSVEYGRQYIDLTRSYTDRWRARAPGLDRVPTPISGPTLEIERD